MCCSEHAEIPHAEVNESAPADCCAGIAVGVGDEEWDERAHASDAATTSPEVYSGQHGTLTSNSVTKSKKQPQQDSLSVSSEDSRTVKGLTPTVCEYAR